MEELAQLLEHQYELEGGLRGRNEPNDFGKAYQAFHDEDYPKAEYLFSEIYRRKGGIQASSDVSVAVVAAWLAYTLLKQDRFWDAHSSLKSLYKTYEAHQSHYGVSKKTDVQFYQMCLYTLGCMELEKAKMPSGTVHQGYLSEALLCLEKNFEIRKFWYGTREKNTIATAFRLGSARYLKKEYDEAHRHLSAIVRSMGRSHVAEDLRYGSRLWLGCNYYMLGDYTNAEFHLKNVPLDYPELVLNHEEQQAWPLRIWYATTLYKQSQYTEAEQIYCDALTQLLQAQACFSTSRDGEPRVTATATHVINNLAGSVHKQPDFQTGHSIFLDIIDGETSHLSPEMGRLLADLYTRAVYEAMFASALEAYSDKRYEMALSDCQDALAWHADKLSFEESDTTAITSLMSSIYQVTGGHSSDQTTRLPFRQASNPEKPDDYQVSDTRQTDYSSRRSSIGPEPSTTQARFRDRNNYISLPDQQDSRPRNEVVSDLIAVDSEPTSKRYFGRLGRAIGQLGRTLMNNAPRRSSSPGTKSLYGYTSYKVSDTPVAELPANGMDGPAELSNFNYPRGPLTSLSNLPSRLSIDTQVQSPGSPPTDAQPSYARAAADEHLRMPGQVDWPLRSHSPAPPYSPPAQTIPSQPVELDSRHVPAKPALSLFTQRHSVVSGISTTIPSPVSDVAPDSYDPASSLRAQPDWSSDVPHVAPAKALSTRGSAVTIHVTENEDTPAPAQESGPKVARMSSISGPVPDSLADSNTSIVDISSTTIMQNNTTASRTSSLMPRAAKETPSGIAQDTDGELTIMPKSPKSIASSEDLSRATDTSEYDTSVTSITSGDPSTTLDLFFQQRPYQESTSNDSMWTEAEIVKVATLLKGLNVAWASIPRTYIVLRTIESLDDISNVIKSGFSDYELPVSERNIPACVDAGKRLDFLTAQKLVLSREGNFESGLGKHHHFGSDDPFPFEFEDRLGAGGFGEVDKVRSKRSNAEFALKRVRRKAVSTSRGLAGMRGIIAEIEILKALNHKHIVKFVGSYTDSRYLGLLMTPVAECDLAEYLLQLQPKQHALLRSFFGCLTAGLHFLHLNRIRHKDLKPGNILVYKQNVLLTDFGLARDFGDATGSTSVGTINGTSPRYCAPEILQMESRNTKSDVWSLGIIFLEMLIALKCKDNEWMDDFMLGHGMENRFIRVNMEGCKELMGELRKIGLKADNVVLDWVDLMLAMQHIHRPTAASLLELILDPELSNGRFCGLCCRSTDESSDEEDD